MARRAQYRVEESRARVCMQADRDVLERRHFPEQFEVLECPANSGAGALGGRVASDIPRAKMQRPAADPVHAGNEIEQRGLTGSIGPNQTMHAAAPDREIDAIDRQQSAEPPRQAPRLEQPRLVRRSGPHCTLSPLPAGFGVRRVTKPPRRRPNVVQIAARPPSPNSSVAIRIAPNTSIR